MRTAMRVHFLHRNVRDTVIIIEEGNLPHPRFPRCDILLPWRALNRQHLTTAQCAKRAEWKRQHMTEEEMRESAEMAFQAYNRPLVKVTLFI